MSNGCVLRRSLSCGPTHRYNLQHAHKKARRGRETRMQTPTNKHRLGPHPIFPFHFRLFDQISRPMIRIYC